MPIEDDIIQAFGEAADTLGRPRDPWSGDHIGFYSSLSAIDRTQQKGTRSYAASGYLTPHINRPNLKVLCEATVRKLILDENSAEGVELLQGTQTYEVFAQREIIVSCGVIGSPQLLELSGIGDPEVLRTAGVECLVHNAGVGANFQDHIASALVYELPAGTFSMDSFQDPEVVQQHQKAYLEDRTGAFAAGPSCMGFLPYSNLATSKELEETVKSISGTSTRSSFQDEQLQQVAAHLQNSESANLQMLVIPARMDFEAGVSDQSKLISGAKGGDGNNITIVMGLQYPASRGSVHITSSDPFVQPRIDPACKLFSLHRVCVI